MKKVKVISEFIDKYDNSVVYRVGEEVSFDATRADDLVSRGLAVCVEVAEAKEEEVATLVTTSDPMAMKEATEEAKAEEEVPSEDTAPNENAEGAEEQPSETKAKPTRQGKRNIQSKE